MKDDHLYPLRHISREVIYLKHFITNKNIEVGDYTYYHDTKNPERFEKDNVVMCYFSKLCIGKFCQIAQGTKFIMSDANHQMDGFSTYPFHVFGGEWAAYEPNWHRKGDTNIGNDVWLAHQSVILPGITIGDGAIVAACSVVTKNVPPYAIVAGNPAKIIRTRFDEATISQLLQIKWWDWNYEKISRNIKAIVGADIQALLSAK